VIAWWGWLVIWVALVILLLGMYAFFGLRLFRKGVKVLRELEKLTDQVANLSANVTELQPEPSQNAILVGYPTIYRQRESFRRSRDERKQVRREKTLERGKLLVRTDISRRTWPHAR
jgi:hypothetical protein